MDSQQELELSRDRYVELYDFAPVGCVTLNVRGVICECNLTAAGMLGLDRPQLLRTPLRLRVHPEDQAVLSHFFRQLKRPGSGP